MTENSQPPQPAGYPGGAYPDNSAQAASPGDSGFGDAGFGDGQPRLERDAAGKLQPGKFSATECISIGFKTVFTQPWVWVGAMLISFVVGIIASIVLKAMGIDTSDLDLPNGGWGELSRVQKVIVGIVNVILYIVDVVVSYNMYRNAYRAFNGQRVTLGSFLELRGIVKPFITSILIYIISVIGLVLLIIPGFIALVLLWATPALMMLFTQLSIGDSLKATAALGKRNFGSVIVLGILGAVLLVVSALLLVIPYLFVEPAVAIATAASFYIGYHGQVRLPQKA